MGKGKMIPSYTASKLSSGTRAQACIFGQVAMAVALHEEGVLPIDKLQKRLNRCRQLMVNSGYGKKDILQFDKLIKVFDLTAEQLTQADH